MAITDDSKNTIKNEVVKLEARKDALVKRIQQLKDKRDSLIAQRDEVVTKINNLKADAP